MANLFVHGIKGNDAQSGSSVDQAKKTIAAAVSASSSGDTIYIKGGITYDEGGITITNKTLYFKCFSTDNKKPIIKLSEGQSFGFKIDDSTGKNCLFQNIIFYDVSDRPVQAVYIVPTTSYGSAVSPAVTVENCDFFLDRETLMDVTIPKYGVYKEYYLNYFIKVDHCVFYNTYCGVYIVGRDKNANVVQNSIFDKCGYLDSLIGAITGMRDSGAGSADVVIVGKNNFFHGCSLIAFTLEGHPTVTLTDSVQEDDIKSPLFNDLESLDFSIKDGSPCVDAGTGSYDANIPPALGETTPDVGSFGGPHNIDTSNEKTIIVDGETITYVIYDVLNISGKDFFIRWVGDSNALSLIDDQFTKTTTMYMNSPITTGVSIDSLTSNEVNMTAGILDLKIEKGSTFKRTLIWRDVDGNIIDTSSGYTAAMKIKDRVGGSTLISLTDGSGITLGASTIDIEISASDTSALTDKYAVYDLEITTGGVVVKLIRGKVEIIDEVTV